MRKVAIILSASGSGKTTLGRELAGKLGVPFVELDALIHGPDWQEISDERLRALVEPVVASDGWVIDGNYDRKLSGLVGDAADTIVWLDLPIRVWLPRLLRRSHWRLRSHEELWNGNRESAADVLWGRTRLSDSPCGCTSSATASIRSRWRAIRSCDSAPSPKSSHFGADSRHDR